MLLFCQQQGGFLFSFVLLCCFRCCQVWLENDLFQLSWYILGFLKFVTITEFSIYIISLRWKRRGETYLQLLSWQIFDISRVKITKCWGQWDLWTSQPFWIVKLADLHSKCVHIICTLTTFIPLTHPKHSLLYVHDSWDRKQVKSKYAFVKFFSVLITLFNGNEVISSCFL